MYKLSPTIKKIGAWNWWLWRVYGRRTLLLDLLARNGLTPEELETLQSEHLDAYLDAMLEYLKQVDTGHDWERRHEVMVRHYGLATGNRESLQSIADDYNLSRERIRQLVEKRLSLFRSEKGMADLQATLVSKAKEVLGKT